MLSNIICQIRFIGVLLFINKVIYDLKCKETAHDVRPYFEAYCRGIYFLLLTRKFQATVKPSVLLPFLLWC